MPLAGVLRSVLPGSRRMCRTGRLGRLVASALAIMGFTIPAASAKSPAELFGPFAKGAAVTVDHGAWSKLLAAYVVPGKDGLNRVAYGRFKAEGKAALEAYIAGLEAVDVSTLDRPEQFAFWANLYNAKTISIVLDRYPVRSIKDINLGGGLIAAVTGGPWKAKVLKVMGADLSLDDIEHGILRALFRDARVHYAVNCASIGCPNLGREAFSGANLDAALDAAAKAYVNHPRGVAVVGGEITASSIYDWFKGDFGGSDEGVLRHVRLYAASVLKAKLDGMSAISGFDYDWSLNDAAP